jgi:hypothetical protein
VDGGADKREARAVETKTYVERLRSIERQYAAFDGSDASACVRQLEAWRRAEADREEVCSTRDEAGAWLFMRLCARYGLRPYQRARQKPTTLTIRAPRGFVSKVLWPQFQAMARVFAEAKIRCTDEIALEWVGKEAFNETLMVDEAPAESE